MFNLGFAVPCYNAMLCLYYLAIIRFEIKEDALVKYEKYMHAVSILLPLIGSILGVVFDLFHEAGG